ncbi:MAG TPA: hypothetical protein VLD39_14565 [Gammaproteobacteria bacterium]|nr:hypothetical protein [Gammaproteobacteria bacterium]
MQPAPAQQAAAQQAPAGAIAMLPRTASPVPLLGVLGVSLTMLGAAFTVLLVLLRRLG